jgi:nucleotide-binding universal stress UspA family protein
MPDQPPGAPGPVVIGFDGSSSATYTVRTAAALLAPAPALVVVVWEPDLSFELLPSPPTVVVAPIDVRATLDIDRSLYDSAQRLADTGVEVARRAGLDAEGLVVADDGTVADTLLQLSRERNARAVVVGTHGRRRLLHQTVGSTARAVVESALCPAVVIRHRDADHQPASPSPQDRPPLA